MLACEKGAARFFIAKWEESVNVSDADQVATSRVSAA
jgi:hypothetical protein